MAVQVTTLDTLTKRAHFDPEVARAIGDAIAMEISSSRDDLVTKQVLRAELLALRNELKSEIAALGVSIRYEMKELASQLRTEFRQEISRLEIKMSEDKADIVRWMFTALVGHAALMVGIMYFMLQHFR